MSSSEVSWKARLQSVPHDELIGLLSTLLSQQSLGRVAADAVIAKHVPPSEAQATVFLSADLIDPLFETLQLTDSAASLVSTTWAEAWRRHLPLIAAVKPGGENYRLPVRGPLNAIALSADTVLVSHAAHGHPESHGLSLVSTSSWEPLELSFVPGQQAFAKSQPSGMAFDEQNQWLFVSDLTIGKQSLTKWLACPSDGVMEPLLREPRPCLSPR